jgi:hypothetical protein
MATRKGKEGIVKVGTTVVGEVKSFELEVTANEVDTSIMGVDWTKTDSTQNSWSGTMEVFYDPTDTGQQGLAVGDMATLAFYYEGSTTGLKYDTGTALITSISKSQSFDSMVNQTVAFSGNGTLTTSTVAE